MATAVSFCATIGNGSPLTGGTRSLGEAYPITRDGSTFGWDSDRTAQSRDRSGPYGELAGIVFVANGGAPGVFTADLGISGIKRIQLALGDFGAGQGPHKVVIKDGSTVRATINVAATAIGEFGDATGAIWDSNTFGSPTNWRDNNLYIDLVFSGTVMNVEVGDPSGSGLTTISRLAFAHVSGGGGSSTTPLKTQTYRRR